MRPQPTPSQPAKPLSIRWIGRRLGRSLLVLLSWCILNTLLLPDAVSAPWPVDQNSHIPSPTVAQAISMTLPSPIFKRWIHAREEDQGDVRVYHPIDYPFPPARGREGLEFRENGEFIRYSMGATDRSVGVPGQWSAQSRNVVEVQFPNQSASPYTLTILECDGQVLKVRQAQG